MSNPLSVVKSKLLSAGASYLIVFSVDEHNSEYVPAQFNRLKFITGFTGSTGVAVICDTGINYFWTDGRYWTQAEKELNKDEWHLMKSRQAGVPTVQEFILNNIRQDGLVAVNPKILSIDNARFYENAFKSKGIQWLWTWEDWIDDVWQRNIQIDNKIFVFQQTYAGESFQNKLSRIHSKMQHENVKSLVLSKLDDIAWTVNMRGSDIPYNTVFYAFLVITQGSQSEHNDDACKTLLFIQRDKIDSDASLYLQSVGIELQDINHFYDTISYLPEPVWIDPASNYATYLSLTKNASPSSVILKTSPITCMKCIKNALELQGMIDSHLEDSAALVEFFCWLEQQASSQQQCSNLSEYYLACKATEFRSKKKNYFSESFETISSVGANAAIIHYKPSHDNSSLFCADQIYLLDSGAHYFNGTTDVTRTWHFGLPSERIKQCYTRVLQGFLDLCSVQIPIGLSEGALDALARTHLWNAGLDYQHGTGHGVGHFLCVHENPPLISSQKSQNQAYSPIQENMCFTIEPGYYEPGSFGIRIENVVHVSKSPANPGFLVFNHLTLVPINTRMIVKDLLTTRQIHLLNDYHQRVYDLVGPKVDSQTAEWLKRVTRPI